MLPTFSIPDPIALFWLRRDLRLDDNAGLYHALKSGLPVLPLFIFDRNILDELPERQDARVSFIYQAISDLKKELNALGADLLVLYGKPEEIWPALLEKLSVGAVYTNRDYEPYAKQRDGALAAMFEKEGIPFRTFKDQVIFESDEVLKDDGKPYTVFTPYSRKWLAKLDSRWSDALNEEGVSEKISFYLKSYPTRKYADNLLKISDLELPLLSEMGFEPTTTELPSKAVARSIIRNYDKTRDFPGQKGTSRLGVHFRFGTISIREKARHARSLNATYLNELIWRDFYSQIMAHFPQVAHAAFKPQYERVPWRDAPEDFEKWRLGKTGYPIVDAGMRELLHTGFMHNRVRMITASFLTKHLLIDWRQGEAWFAQKLLDYDLASNSGGWQWAAGCGTDTAPYFRIFNPTEQTKKFDPDYTYIRKWVPEFGTPAYVKPMVEHTFARNRCLETYKRALAE